jgi:integrase
LTDRAFEAFLELRGTRTAEEWNDTPVFPFASVKRSWYKALELAGIDNLHFHDLRGTGITRMLDAGVPVPVVMKFSGHDQYETFMKYVKKDLGIIQNAGAAMSEHYNNRKAELAKGRVPLSPVPEKSSGDIAEVTELGEAIN